MNKRTFVYFVLAFLFAGTFFIISPFSGSNISYEKEDAKQLVKEILPKVAPTLDVKAYDLKLAELANNPIPKIVTQTIITKDAKGKSIKKVVPLDPQPVPPPSLWPVKTVYPNAGAILPFNRIVAYYGNLYSTKMGVLGEYGESEMFSRLSAEVKKWQEADPSTPVIPALHYIAVVAQGSPGKDGKYRSRMPDTEIDKVIQMANKINAIVFLDFQVAFSTLEQELPRYEKYFKMPNVHLGIDPEFSMKGTIRPGKVVGTYDAVDVNYSANFLAKIVKENNLTPKVLVVHRYTEKMLTNYRNIKPLPEVQIVVHMDGWGEKAKKLNTYEQFVQKQPVQFTGFKLFYKNDIWQPNAVMFTPAELIRLNPRPSYIQYQ
jgi:hypothetical protein